MAVAADFTPADEPPVNINPVVFIADPAHDNEPHWSEGHWLGKAAATSVATPGYAFGGPDPCFEAVAANYTGRAGATLTGFRPLSGSTQVKTCQKPVGSFWPMSGSWTITYELTADAAWSTQVGTQWWDVGSTPFVWLRRNSYSATTQRLSLEYYDPDGNRQTPIIAWVYGNTYSGVVMPAPAGGQPVRERIVFDRSARTLKWWVEHPSNPAAWVLIGTTTLAAGREDLWYGINGMSPANQFTFGSASMTGWTMRGFVLYDGAWPPGSSLTYDDVTTATVDRLTNLGEWQPFEKWGVQHMIIPNSRSVDSPIDGLPEWSVDRTGWRDTAVPLPGVRAPTYTLDKITRQKYSFTEDVANGVTSLGWSSGRTIPTRAGGTRTGYTIYADWRPVDNVVNEMIASYGEGYRVLYRHNTNSELTGGGTSDWRLGTKGLKTATKACSHPNIHPQAVPDGANIHADICVDNIHRLLQAGLTIDSIAVGTEVTTSSQFSQTNRDVDHVELYDKIRDAVRNYCTVEMGDPDAIWINFVGYGGWSSTSATTAAAWTSILGVAVAAGLAPDNIDVHYNQGPAGIEWTYRQARKALIAAGLGSNLIVTSDEDYTCRDWSWKLNPIVTTGRQPDGLYDIRTCADAIHLGGFGVFARHHHCLDAAWYKSFSPGPGGSADEGYDPEIPGSISLSDKDKFTTKWGGEESPRYGVERMLCKTEGIRHPVTFTGLSNWIGEAGTRTDGRSWFMGAIGRMHPWLTGQDSLTVDMGAAAANKTFGWWRVTRTIANWPIRYTNDFDVATDRVKREATVQADGSGVLVLNSVAPTEVLLLLEDSALVAGTIVGGTSSDTTAAVGSSVDASGGTETLTYSWYRSTGSGTLGSLLVGKTAATLGDTGLAPETTYWYTRRVSDGYNTADTAQVSVTTTAAPVGDAGNDDTFGSAVFASDRFGGKRIR